MLPAVQVSETVCSIVSSRSMHVAKDTSLALDVPVRERPVLVLQVGADSDLRDRLPDMVPHAVVGLSEDASTLDPNGVRELLSSCRPSVVLVVCESPFDAAYALVRAIRREETGTPILVACDTSDEGAVTRFLGLGIDEYVTPPFSVVQIAPRLRRLVGSASPCQEQPPACAPAVELEGLVGRSEAFRETARQVATIADCDATCLIEGETGTGKELVARAIHRLSARRAGGFVPVNCGALPGDLVENELFGHRRAAFTGASVAQVGLVREADGGSLMLDEIDCLAAGAQASLLRFVQDREYRPLGSTRIVRADVRILAVTNTDLATAAERGRFRQDLYYRLDLLRLRVPPLRERCEDVPLLAEHFRRLYGDRFRASADGFSSEALEAMRAYHWPGNVRELEHVVARAVALGVNSSLLTAQHVQIGGRTHGDGPESFLDAKRRVVTEFERTYLSSLLVAHRGNIAQAARAAGKNRRAFWELMRKHAIRADAFRRPSPAGESADRRP